MKGKLISKKEALEIAKRISEEIEIEYLKNCKTKESENELEHAFVLYNILDELVSVITDPLAHRAIDFVTKKAREALDKYEKFYKE